MTQIEPYSGVGNLIGTTFELFTQNLWLITKLVFLLYAPLEIIRVLKFGFTVLTWEQSLGITALSILCSLLIAPSLTFGLFYKLRNGTDPTVHECYRWGLSRLPKYLLLVVITGFLIGLGFICLVVPGIILMVVFVPVTPLATLENHGPIEVLKRSLFLTNGRRGAIFVGLVCTIGLVFVLKIVPTIFLYMFAGIEAWPVRLIGAVVGDILDQLSTVLALVYYVSVLSWRPRSSRAMSVY